MRVPDFLTIRDSAKVDALRVVYAGARLEQTPVATQTPVFSPTATPPRTATPMPTATPSRTPAPTPTLTIEQALSQLEQRLRALEEAVREILDLLPQP